MITTMRGCVAHNDLWPWPISSRSFGLDLENRVRSVAFTVLDGFFLYFKFSKFYTHIKDRYLNTLRPRQNGRHFADDTFKRIFLNENNKILIKISLKFVPKGPINKIPALVQIMAWRRPGDKPLSEPMMASSTTHIVTRHQWVKHFLWNCPGMNATCLHDLTDD